MKRLPQPIAVPSSFVMKKAFPMTLGSPARNLDCIDQARECNSIVVPSRNISLEGTCRRSELPWLSTCQIQTDLSIDVEDITFNVHKENKDEENNKFQETKHALRYWITVSQYGILYLIPLSKYPLISKCGYIRRLDIQPSISNSRYNLKLENFPGGLETFHIILKFCYGLPVDLNTENVAALRCASEYLEMTEELEDGNLITKTEAFLSFVILSSRRDTITVLKSCEDLSPWAENLQIVRRCIDSIAWNASRDHPSTGETASDEFWWLDEVAELRIDHFTRFITALRAKGTKPETIGKCIMHFAERSLPGMDTGFEGLRGHGHGKNESQFNILGSRNELIFNNSQEQRTVVESLINILPPQQEAVSCHFLSKMLKMAILSSTTPVLITELEKRMGMTLEDADVDDLLIPCYRKAEQAVPMKSPESLVYDLDVVQRIIEYFLMYKNQQQPQKSGFQVSKLLDNYLVEIARDPSLSITRFQVLAESLPESTRSCDDGLYRAIDTYLKSHPSMSEYDRRRLCKTMTCQKLSVDACMHAAQNDRLSLRTIVQVMLSEQVKMRASLQEKEVAQESNNSENEGKQTSTDREVKILRAELESVKVKMAELQSDYTELQQKHEKMSNKQRRVSLWVSSWKNMRTSHHKKVLANEMGEDQERPNQFGCRASFISRTRMSIS